MSARMSWACVGGVDAEDAVAGGLGLGARDAELLADDAIEEGGFARVGFPDNGDDPGASHEAKGSEEWALVQMRVDAAIPRAA